MSVTLVQDKPFTAGFTAASLLSKLARSMAINDHALADSDSLH